jgi:hypothetical protein
MWGDASHHAAVLRCLHGRLPDVIIAADIVAAPYEEALPSLQVTLEALCGEHTTVYIAHKPRHVCEERWLRRVGKTFHVLELPRDASVHADFRDSSNIRILQLRKRSQGAVSKGEGGGGAGAV